MHHRLDIAAQLPRQHRVGQVALDKIAATRTQRLHSFGAPSIDPHLQALRQGKIGKTPADKAAGPGYQNLHCRPLCSCPCPL